MKLRTQNNQIKKAKFLFFFLKINRIVKYLQRLSRKKRRKYKLLTAEMKERSSLSISYTLK